jgi:hypothetical protein
MSDKYSMILLITTALTIVFLSSCFESQKEKSKNECEFPVQDARPYTRWWWFASEIKKSDIKNQLDWLNKNHFGGVEIAFIYPVNRDPNAKRVPWLGPEWTELVTYAKQYCDSIGFGCDFTFGTLWPFGGTFVADSDRTKVYGDTAFKQPLRLSWTHPDTGNVIDHLNKGAFDRYAKVMGKALQPAMDGSKSSLFCDSWEVETHKIWTKGFGEKFKAKYGYEIEPFMDHIYDPGNEGPRYDYMKLVAEMVLKNFYLPFTEKSHELRGYSRVQCAGSPTDIIDAYASVDIPETEAMLYNPGFSQIVASAAALAGKPIVSCETFTCLYGWPANHIRQEQTADLKLVADALFANGTNHIIWHGTPFNPLGIDTLYFYASVHVGEKGNLTNDLKEFNQYLEKVSDFMRQGKPYTDIAVYIPQEDAWIAGELPKDKQLPWAWGEYEMRYTEFHEELTGYQPSWVNKSFLEQGLVQDGELLINGLKFNLLYVDVNYMDIEALKRVKDLADQGFSICLKKLPKQAGFMKDPVFQRHVDALSKLPNVSNKIADLNIPKPLMLGEDIPEFRCRVVGDEMLIFISHPLAADLTYPLSYGQSFMDSTFTEPIQINTRDGEKAVQLVFEPYQSLLLSIKPNSELTFENIEYTPPLPVKNIE